jgi:hypothetical protein
MTTKDLIKKETVTTTGLPSFIDPIEKADETLLQVNSDDLEISSVSLVQDKHPAKKKFDDINEGDYVDMMSGRNYGQNPEIIVCKHQKTWRKTDGRDIIGFSTDGVTWDDGTKLTIEDAYRCLEHNFFVMFVDNPEPIPTKIKFKRTSQKAGKNLLNLLLREIQTNKAPINARKYILGSETVSFPKGDVLVMTVQASDYVSKNEFGLSNQIIAKIRDVKMKENANSSSDDELSLD